VLAVRKKNGKKRGKNGFFRFFSEASGKKKHLWKKTKI